MWISKKKYNQMVEDLDAKNEALGKLKAAADIYKDAFIASETTTERFADNVGSLIEMLNNVINITFDENKGFETVVFQPYGKAPEIFYKGKKLDVGITDEIDITMIDGISVIEVTKTHA